MLFTKKIYEVVESIHEHPSYWRDFNRKHFRNYPDALSDFEVRYNTYKESKLLNHLDDEQGKIVEKKDIENLADDCIILRKAFFEYEIPYPVSSKSDNSSEFQTAVIEIREITLK